MAIIFSLLFYLIFAFIGEWFEIKLLSDQSLLGIFGNGLGLGLVIFYAYKKNPTLTHRIQYARIEGKLYIPLIITALGVSIFLSEVDNLTRSLITIPDFFMNQMLSLFFKWNVITTYILLAVIAPVTEEILFRGVIFNGVSVRYGHAKAIVLTSILFGIFHLNPVQIVGATLIGFVLGWLRATFNSITVPILFHSICNSIPFIMMRVIHIEIKGYSTLTSEATFQPLWFDVLGVVLIIYGLYIINRRSTQKNNKRESILNDSMEQI